MTHGNFVDNVARIDQRGGIPNGDGSGNGSFIDVFTFTMGEGSRPSVQTVSGLPAVGSDTSGVSGYKVESITFRQDSERSLVWHADVSNKRKSLSSETEDFPGRIFKRTWGSKSIQKDMVIDAQGRQVKNSAGEPFESVPSVEIVVPSITIETVQSSSPASLIEGYSGTVNNSAITICGISIQPRAGRIVITGGDSDDENYPYSVAYQIDIMTNPVNEEDSTLLYGPSGASYGETGGLLELGYDVGLLNCGYTYNYNDERLRFYDNPSSTGIRPDGTNAGEGGGIDPALLEPSTVPMPIGANGEDRREYGDSYTIVFQRYRGTDWSALHLPQN